MCARNGEKKQMTKKGEKYRSRLSSLSNFGRKFLKRTMKRESETELKMKTIEIESQIRMK